MGLDVVEVFSGRHLKVFYDIHNALQRLEVTLAGGFRRGLLMVVSVSPSLTDETPLKMFYREKNIPLERGRGLELKSPKILKFTNCVQTFINWKQNSEKWKPPCTHRKARLLFLLHLVQARSPSFSGWTKGMRMITDQSSARGLGCLERTKSKEDNIWKSFYCGCF